MTMHLLSTSADKENFVKQSSCQVLPPSSTKNYDLNCPQVSKHDDYKFCLSQSEGELKVNEESVTDYG